MAEHKSVSLADCVFERLEQDILSGRYACEEMIGKTRFEENFQNYEQAH